MSAVHAAALPVWHPLKSLVFKPWRWRKREIGFVAEYICEGKTFYWHVGAPEKDAEASHVFREWWAQHGGMSPPPATLAEALSRTTELCVAGVRCGAGAEWAHWRIVARDTFDHLLLPTVH